MDLAGNAIVLRPVADLFSSPSDEVDMVSQAIYGSNVEILESRGGWSRVRTDDGYTGWTLDLALRRSEKKYATEGTIGWVSNLFANLYSEPSITHRKPLLTLPFDSRLEVIQQQDKAGERFVQVRLADDSAAWIQSGDLSFSSQRLTFPEITALAQRFAGIPYLWGGISSFGYDCSGFTQMLCRRRGVILPRDAHLQAAWDGVTPVQRSDLAPGDLLFFGDKPGRITHTGMYVGDGKFIHATAYVRPVVQISRLEEPHWGDRLLAARRLK